MRSKLFNGFVLAIALCFAAVKGEAKEVTLSHNGLTLSAELELAADKALADGVVLITHGALAHRDMEAIVTFRELLHERGYSTLAINLSLGVDNRRGMYDCGTLHRHRNEDAVEEIGLWLDWLKGQGAKQVTLLGHSRGGAQTALFAAQRSDPVVKAVVLLAPATGDNTDAASYEKRYEKPLAPLLEKARKLVAEGKGDTPLEQVGLMSCRDTDVTAETFLSYYGQDSSLDTPSLIPKLETPVLVVVAGNDQVVVGLDKKVAALADGKRVQLAVVDGADHLFRDLYADDAVEAIDQFLSGVGD